MRLVEGCNTHIEGFTFSIILFTTFTVFFISVFHTFLPLITPKNSSLSSGKYFIRLLIFSFPFTISNPVPPTGRFAISS